MTNRVLLSVLLALACALVHAAPVEDGGVQPGSCDDASAKGAAALALEKINHDRTEGYIFHLHRLSNVHMEAHGEAGMVFYLTLDVVETNCSVLMKDHSKTCVARPQSDVPVYGQCKAAIYISKVHRVVRLYKYDCVIRPVSGASIHQICPDCPNLMRNENEQVLKTVAMALESFNKDSKLNHHFSLLKINRATSGMAIGMYYNVEFTIQETTCDKSVFPAVKCPKMECEFAHKGFCHASLFNTPAGQSLSVECDIFEPEAAEREKKLHLLGGETDHSHQDATAANQNANHDHEHDHTKSHVVHEATHQHAADADHHHTHDHTAGSSHRHAHDHSHDHGHNHDHVHTHHGKAHSHDGDFPNQHHNYTHGDNVHTHDHDHELALDHDHKHAHLHEHEHHHHHHKHEHETSAHDHPEGSVRMLPARDPDVPMVLPAFPDAPAAGPEVGVTLPLKPDPQIPGMTEPTIKPFPSQLSAQCPPVIADSMLDKAFSEDALFKASA